MSEETNFLRGGRPYNPGYVEPTRTALSGVGLPRCERCRIYERDIEELLANRTAQDAEVVRLRAEVESLRNMIGGSGDNR